MAHLNRNATNVINRVSSNRGNKTELHGPTKCALTVTLQQVRRRASVLACRRRPANPNLVLPTVLDIFYMFLPPAFLAPGCEETESEEESEHHDPQGGGAKASNEEEIGQRSGTVTV